MPRFVTPVILAVLVVLVLVGGRLYPNVAR